MGNFELSRERTLLSNGQQKKSYGIFPCCKNNINAIWFSSPKPHPINDIDDKAYLLSSVLTEGDFYEGVENGVVS